MVEGHIGEVHVTNASVRVTRWDRADGHTDASNNFYVPNDNVLRAGRDIVGVVGGLNGNRIVIVRDLDALNQNI